jgi:RNA polymerase sigma factor (sigma-70 family)
MSPLTLRRYRAERLLRGEFEAMRERVLRAVQARLRGSGGALSRCDLEACYAAAWQGLYMATLEGAHIDDPAAWLVLVTFRRALDERRARARGGELLDVAVSTPRAPAGVDAVATRELDLAEELDDRRRLRQLFEGLRGRLGEREREAAVLCYLQGLTRAEAAARMGVSEARMRKLMEGRAGRPGVAGKVGALVSSIREERWCEEQGSLMRALAFGVLDPGGERRRLALAHALECPGCRAYVSSLRGLAAVLPPALAPWSLAAARLGGSLSAPAAAGGASGAVGGGSAAVTAGSGAGAAAGGGWLLASGPLTAKLAIGCVLAVGLGAGCTLEAGMVRQAHVPRYARPARTRLVDPRRASAAVALVPSGSPSLGAGQRTAAGRPGAGTASGPLTPATRASREFGLARAQGPGSSSGAVTSQRRARAASAAGTDPRLGDEATGGAGNSVPTVPRVTPGSQVSTMSSAQAAREFSPG